MRSPSSPARARVGDARTRSGTVDRAFEIGAIERAFDEGAIVVTVFGMPGVGKSWIAERVASRRGALECGLDDSGDLLHALAAAFEVSPPSDPELLATRLLARARDVPLVVLDGADAVLAAVADLGAKWIASGTRTPLLVTSREPLRIGGARRIAIAPLAPAEAAKMFVTRARGLFGEAAIAPDDLGEVAAIADAVDGLPLGIELALSRLDSLDVRSIHLSIDRSMNALRSGFLDTPARHTSLEAAFAGAFESLEPLARRVLRAASLFRGGFTAEALLDVAAPGVDEGARLEAFASLRLRSLVLEAGTRRFRLANVVRDLVLRAAEPDDSELARAHAAYFAERARVHEPSWLRDAPGELLPERENLRAAFAHALESAPSLIAPLVCGLHAVLPARGPRALHFEVLEAALARAGDELARAHVRTRLAEARMHWDLDRTAGEVLVDTARVFREHGDTRPFVRATLTRAYALIYVDRMDDAVPLVDEALALARAIDDRRLCALALRARARLSFYRDPSRAEGILHETLSIAAERVAPNARADVLSDLSHLCLNRGDYTAAVEHASRALAIHERMRSGMRIAFSHADLAIPYWMLGDRDAARSAHEAAIEEARAQSASRAEGLFLGYAGICEVVLGERALGVHSLALAVHRMAEVDDALYLSVFEAWYAAALARDGDHGHALELAERVRARPRPLRQERATEALVSFARGVAPESIAPSNIVEERLVELFLARAAPPAAPVSYAQDGVLRVDAEGFYCVLPGGGRIDLQRKPVLRRVLATIAARAVAGAPARLADVIAGGWPGEKLLPDAAAHRAYVAVSSLRRLGLRDRLRSRGDGYEFVGPIELTRRAS